MSRPVKNYRLWRNKQTGYYYFRLRGGPWRSTGEKSETKADNIASDAYRKAEIPKTRVQTRGTVYSYFEPYFDWNRCPRIADRRAEGRQISPQHAARQRRVLEKYVLKDMQLMGKALRAVIPDDIRQYRQRLLNMALTPRVINAAVLVVKTIFRDLLRRGVLERDPSTILGAMKYAKKTRGTFTPAELQKLFAECPGPWGDLTGYVAFRLAAVTGCRRGEILAIRWRHLDLETGKLHVEAAWKDARTLGTPKWGQVRMVKITGEMVKVLKQYRAASLHVLPDSLVLCNEDGGRLGTTWWKGRFHAALKAAGIPVGNRSPHSFGHSLATLWREAGVPDPLIKAALGWSETSKTIEDYSHLSAQFEQAEKIEKILGYA